MTRTPLGYLVKDLEEEEDFCNLIACSSAGLLK